LGDPLSDLIQALFHYYVPDKQNFFTAIRPIPSLQSRNVPTASEQLSFYYQEANKRGVAKVPEWLKYGPDTPQWRFYIAFALFRVGAVMQGVYKRALDGNSSQRDALTMGSMPQMLFDASAQYLKEPIKFGHFSVVPEAMSPKAFDFYCRVDTFINEVF
jgi:aminoglycoside phosphotransferase (APT) family kinase protein